MKAGTLVIYRSSTGKRKWKPVLPAAVPAWLKDPEVLGRLVAGEMAHKPKEGWYRAEKLADSPIVIPRIRVAH